MTSWTNWGLSVEANPARVEHPASTADVVAIVREAAAAGQKVKAIGAGHSFTAIGSTDGVLLHLARMHKILGWDMGAGRVRVQAGISLHDLNPILKRHGLAFPNLGDIDPQSIAGAVSTGTHGTGGDLHGISSAVVGVQLVTAGGDVLEIDEQHEFFGASGVTLGALGIITEITLQSVPAFLLHAREEPIALPEVLDRIDEHIEDNDHFEFYWFPHTDKALLKRNNRVAEGTEPRPVGRFKRWLDDEFLSNEGFDIINKFARRTPRLIPRINNLTASVLSAREYVDDSFNVFVSPRRVKFRESEFAVPRYALQDVLDDLRVWLDAGHERITFPIEVRFTAADDVWMSTGHERDNAYVAVHQYYKTDYREFFGVAESIFTEHEGRPHWGKIHTLDADYLRKRYARFDDFVAIRDQLDPTRLFSNAYLDRVLG
ncbi:MAG: D-arabinono-1,4-lactone oxidase [Aeromicrobium sp.]